MLRRCVLVLALEALREPNYPLDTDFQKNLNLYVYYYEMDRCDIVICNSKLAV